MPVSCYLPVPDGVSSEAFVAVTNATVNDGILPNKMFASWTYLNECAKMLQSENATRDSHGSCDLLLQIHAVIQNMRFTISTDGCKMNVGNQHDEQTESHKDTTKQRAVYGLRYKLLLFPDAYYAKDKLDVSLFLNGDVVLSLMVRDYETSNNSDLFCLIVHRAVAIIHYVNSKGAILLCNSKKAAYEIAA